MVKNESGENAIIELIATGKVNKDKIRGEKELDIWYSMMDKKHLGAFKKLDTSNSISDMKRCRKLKEKYGVVHHKVIAFK